MAKSLGARRSPCNIALGSAAVPARRWTTRTDVFSHLERSRQFMDANFDQRSAVSLAAREAGLSLHHFVRLFAETYGKAPLAYVSQKRIEHACDLLRRTAMPVAAIGVECGFGNASAFSRSFRKQLGLAPGDFRKSCTQSKTSDSE